MDKETDSERELSPSFPQEDLLAWTFSSGSVPTVAHIESSDGDLCYLHMLREGYGDQAGGQGEQGVRGKLGLQFSFITSISWAFSRLGYLS